jgi:hypothetical protein
VVGKVKEPAKRCKLCLLKKLHENIKLMRGDDEELSSNVFD